MSLLLLFSGSGRFGILAQTEADDTLASATTLALAAAAAITEAGDTLSAASALALAALAAITEAGDNVSSAAAVALLGAASITEADDSTVNGAVGWIRPRRHSQRYWRALYHKRTAIPAIRDMN